MIRRVLYRARAVYVTQIVVFLVVVAAIEFHLRGAERWNLDLVTAHPWKGIAYGATLLYQPEYSGILPMYLLFLLLTPFVLWQFDKGNAGHVLGLSALAWMLSGLLVRVPDDPAGLDLGSFNPIGYQFVFVAGLAFGTGRLSIERLPQVIQRRLLTAAAIVTGIGLVMRVEYAAGGPLSHFVDEFGVGLSAEQLGPLRLLNFAAFGLVFYWATRNVRRRDGYSRAYSWLAFVGRHSLPVFAWSILVAYAAVALLPPHMNFAAGLLAAALVTASLTLPAQLHAFARQKRASFVSARRIRPDDPTAPIEPLVDAAS